jgi:hypothetical protein
VEQILSGWLVDTRQSSQKFAPALTSNSEQGFSHGLWTTIAVFAGSQDIRSADRDLNPGLHRYEAGVLTTLPLSPVLISVLDFKITCLQYKTREL